MRGENLTQVGMVGEVLYYPGGWMFRTTDYRYWLVPGLVRAITDDYGELVAIP